jgi:hypothetical protein
MKQVFTMLIGCLLIWASPSWAQENPVNKQKEIIKEHIKRLRALADSLEQQLASFDNAYLLQAASEAQVGSDDSEFVHTKKVYRDGDGRIFWQKELPVFLLLSTSSDGKDGYRLTFTKDKRMESFSNPMYWEGVGKHYIRHDDIDPTQAVAFEVNADGIAPKTLVEFKNAPIFAAEGKVYYGKGLVINLTAVDEMSGVRKLYYAFNEQAFQAYTQEVPLETGGEYDLRYYAVDMVGNAEKANSQKFILDLESPQTTLRTIGENKGDVLAPTTTIELTGIYFEPYQYAPDRLRQQSGRRKTVLQRGRRRRAPLQRAVPVGKK